MDFEEIMQDESTQFTVGQRPSDFVTEEKLDVDLSQNIQFHHLDLNNIDPNHFPFWNNQVQEWAQKLPGCQKEDFIPSSFCPLNMKRKPWFTFSYSTQKQKNSTSSSAPIEPVLAKEIVQTAHTKCLEVKNMPARSSVVIAKHEQSEKIPKIPKNEKRKASTKETKPRKKRKLTPEQEEKKRLREEAKLKKKQERQEQKRKAQEAKREINRKTKELTAARLAEKAYGRGGKKLSLQDLEKKSKPKNEQKQKEEKEEQSKERKRKGTKNQSKENKEKEKEKEEIKAKIIRIFPDTDQKNLLRNWFGCARWTYNQCLAEVQTSGIGMKNISNLRRVLINEGCHEGQKTEWVLQTPTEIRTEALRDFVKAYDSNLAKQKKQPDHKFEMKFKSVKAESDSIVISSKRGKDEFKLLSNIRSEKPLNLDWRRDTRLVKKRTGVYYLTIPEVVISVSENQAPEITSKEESIIALDPGVRTFMTGFDSMGNLIEWGKNDVARLCRLKKHSNKLQHRIYNDKTIKHKTRWSMKRALYRLNDRIKHLVDELHRTFAKFLCENYRVIFLPKFETSKMVKKLESRKIGKKTVISMQLLSHFTFRQRLISKAREYPWVTVMICNEGCTTKTCGCCGTQNHNVGGSKIFSCSDKKNCGIQLPRDANGARNVLLRQLGLLEISPITLLGLNIMQNAPSGFAASASSHHDCGARTVEKCK